MFEVKYFKAILFLSKNMWSAPAEKNAFVSRKFQI